MMELKNVFFKHLALSVIFLCLTITLAFAGRKGGFRASTQPQPQGENHWDTIIFRTCYKPNVVTTLEAVYINDTIYICNFSTASVELLLVNPEGDTVYSEIINESSETIGLANSNDNALGFSQKKDLPPVDPDSLQCKLSFIIKNYIFSFNDIGKWRFIVNATFDGDATKTINIDKVFYVDNRPCRTLRGSRILQTQGRDSLFKTKPMQEPQSIINIFPNPFSENLNINYTLSKNDLLSIKLYDMSGKLLRKVIHNKYASAGNHTATVDGSSLKSGVYFCRIQIGDAIESRKIIKY